MGFWNETCMLTNLPIHEKEPCIGFLITTQTNDYGKTPPTAFWHPISTAISGKYNGFGSMEYLKPNYNMLPALNISKFKVRTPIGTYEKLASNQQTLEDIVKLAANETLYLSDRTRKPKPVQLVLIKKTFYDMAICDIQEITKITTGSTRNHIQKYMHMYVFDAFRTGQVPPEEAKNLHAFDMYLQRMRRSWHPTTGSGSQTSIEEQIDLNLYTMMLEIAKDIYLEQRR